MRPERSFLTMVAVEVSFIDVIAPQSMTLMNAAASEDSIRAYNHAANHFGCFPRRRWGFSMIHLRTPDSVGHSRDWDLRPGSDYTNSIITVDQYLGMIFRMINSSPVFCDRIHLIVMSDHGGTKGRYTHIFPGIVTNYTVPFYVWGPEVSAGADLYALNPDYHDPGTSRPSLEAGQPTDS